MSNQRLDRLERRLGPEEGRPVFHFCTEHDDMPWEEHRELHARQGRFLFTLDLGAASIRDDG